MRRSIAILAIQSAVFCTSSFANDEVFLSHKLISAHTYSDKTYLTYQIKLSNIGNTDLSHLHIEPAGREFQGASTSTHIHLSHLPVNGQTEVIWEVDSKRDKAFFQSSTPLFFHVYATADKTSVSQAAYSEEY